jgi:hypothetical protein
MDRPTIAQLPEHQLPVAFTHYPSNPTIIPTATVAYSSSCIPTNIPILPTLEEDMEELRKADTWRLRKTIQFIACIDVIFSIFIFSGIHPALSLICILPYIGYLGAKEYNKNYILFYLFYIGINIGLRIVNVALFRNTYSILLSILSCGIECWLFWLVHKFYKLLSSLSFDSICVLRDGSYRSTITQIMYY